MAEHAPSVEGRVVGSQLGRAPWPLAVPAAIAGIFLLVPLISLMLQTPWLELPRLLSDRQVGQALAITLGTSLLTVVASVVLGTPLAWVLARIEFPGRAALRALVTVPLVLPPVVAGVALIAALGRNGLVGGTLFDLTGLSLPYTTAAVVIAHTFVALPFFVITVEAGLRSLGRRYDDAAATLGATPVEVFLRVTLPLVAPSVIAGAVLAWARALGEFGATITFAGNIVGRTQTLPLAVYLQDLVEMFRAAPLPRSLGLPTLALLSTGATFADAAAMRAELAGPRVALQSIDCHHWPLTERPTEVREAIERWCAGLVDPG
jgi:molybdate transport system permease protein